jgi:crotonobetainyl-CoA:carnitine CoA-transferase CaiB-like acyl-CoA transferase
MTDEARRGPLHGVKVVEIASIGPGPFAATLLAGRGAEVIRVHKPGDRAPVDMPGTRPTSEAAPPLPPTSRITPAVNW